MKSDQRLFYTVGEVAAMLGLSRTYVYAKFDPEKGYDNSFFTVIKIGTRLLVPINDFDRWFDSLKKSD